MANNALKNVCYDFKKATKEEVFQAWEQFLQEEQNRKYSIFMEYHPYHNGLYIDVKNAFRMFVTHILSGYIGTKQDYCKRFNCSEDWFDSQHGDEYAVFCYNWQNEPILMEKVLVDIFRIEYECSLNGQKIVRNFSEEQGKEPALPG